MRVKICGLTRTTDALLALSLGATDLGFIFCESPRQVSPYLAKKIIEELPQGAVTVGVFRDQPYERILDHLSSVPLKRIQLHGKESPEVVSLIKSYRPDIEVFKTIPEDSGVLLVDPALYANSDGLLFDCGHSHFYPLQRRTVKSPIRTHVNSLIACHLAGAINVNNVLSLIELHRPDGIDLSSSVEISPGIKDETLLKAFFATLKGSSHVD